MKGMIRTVLVAPDAEARDALAGLCGAIGTVWLSEVCDSFEGATAVVGQQRPDLIIVAIDGAAAAGLELVSRLAAENPDAAVMPAGVPNDAQLVLRAIRAGAREFLAMPATAEELAGAVKRLVAAGFGAGDSARSSRLVALVGASGGVGCTTLAINVAAALAKDPSHEVALIDADLMLGAVDACLDLVSDRGLLDLTRDVARLDLSLLRRSLIKHESGLYVLPRPTSMEDAARVDPEAFRRVLTMLKATFPIVIVDLGKGFNATDIVALELCDEVLVVVRPEPDCLRNTARLLELFRHFEGLHGRVKIVANRVGASEHEVGLKKAEEILRQPIAWQVPYAPKVFDPARSRGVPAEVEAAGSRAHRALLEIALAYAASPAALTGQGRRLLGRIAASFF